MFQVITVKCPDYQSDNLSSILINFGSIGTEFVNPNLKIYFSLDFSDFESVSNILQNFDISEYKKELIAQENWNATWEENFNENIIDQLIHIRAPHHPTKNLTYDIIIQPNQAFGTGHHPTTSLMIRAMQHIDFSYKRVLDMGCGSGILSIFASLKKAASILAIDYDILSVENTEQNLQLNQINNVEVIKSNDLKGVKSDFDIILSNIITSVNINFWADFYDLLKNEGILVVSGILIDHLPQVENLAQSLKFKKVSILKEEEWLCNIYQKIKNVPI